MPFVGILEILKPFLRGAPGHPNEALFQKGLRILNMAVSYYNISLPHMADHLIHLSLSYITSPRPLFAPYSLTLVARAGCCVASRHAALLLSHCLVLPPSRCLVAPAGCCIISCRHLLLELPLPRPSPAAVLLCAAAALPPPSCCC